MVLRLAEHEFNELLQYDVAREGSVAVRLRDGLWEPAANFLSRPSKEFRARLVDFGWEWIGAQGRAPEPLRAALEALHAGSLIIDDIEDDAPDRRGQPALHVAYGVPMALNCGNWLYFAALRMLRRLPLAVEAEIDLQHRFLDTLAMCHAGQALDISVRLSEIPKNDILPLVTTTTRWKTGALMALAASAAAVALRASKERVIVLHDFGLAFGTTLQMLDDLATLTKRTHRATRYEDLQLDRVTWPWAWLAETVDAETFDGLRARAARVAAGQDDPAELAETLSTLVATTGRAAARERLAAEREKLRALGEGASAVVAAFEVEIERLLACYD
ncbi:polyprenyl synthetase family protein [Pendulispora rubella]|uniref:Polyprenyl synthetase family protein n=1 Tax=Pendulispora rubella TaxID=2741070 RepID=A0ABZ2KVZ9_9BACT